MPSGKGWRRREAVLHMRGTSDRVVRAALWVTLLVWAVPAARGQSYEAFCALRDPEREIRLLAPEYRRHVSLVRTITTESRAQILKEVPFSMHFDELGQHTLYVVLGEEGVLGYVHVRSEAFEWGLVRIAWMMNTDLEIIDYRFQRCRSRWRGKLEEPAVAKYLVRQTMDELKGMLVRGRGGLRGGAVPLPAGAEALMAVLVQSALKTRIATRIVWKEEVASVKVAALARKHFGARIEVLRGVDLYDEDDMSALVANELKSPIGIDRLAVSSWTAVNFEGEAVGSILHTPWSAGDERASLWWVLAANGPVLSVDDAQRSLLPKTRAVFEKLIGGTYRGKSECKTACELAAFEVSLISDLD